jgi:hypothetical protein
MFARGEGVPAAMMSGARSEIFAGFLLKCRIGSGAQRKSADNIDLVDK